ncbi:MAG: hypothetical protein KAJ75_01435 [Alphaproteobacteria bacterium]|nr:hypothetical protein [Alphaproteobacteria bacterium]
MWGNAIAIGTGIAANQCGIDVNGENSIAILGGLNIILRLVTAKGLVSPPSAKHLQSATGGKNTAC